MAKQTGKLYLLPKKSSIEYLPLEQLLLRRVGRLSCAPLLMQPVTTRKLLVRKLTSKKGPLLLKEHLLKLLASGAKVILE